MIVRAPLIFALLGMSALWIGHTDSSIKSRFTARGFYGVSTGITIAF